MTAWQAFREDRARYPRRAWLTDLPLWSILAYRTAQWMDERLAPILVVRGIQAVLQLLAHAATGNEIPHQTQIGAGLMIRHGKGIVLHRDVVIGRDCILRQGVTIGSRLDGGPVPVIGDGVSFGAYAQVLGGLTVGDGAQIGAMSVVLGDVPAGCTAVGIPARILPPRSERS